MLSNIVFTLTGTDRIGIVEEVTGMLFNLGGNVETSRMARLGGEFAILLLVSIPSDRLGGLDEAVGRLTAQGFKVAFCATEKTYAETHRGWLPCKIEVQGADHEGIIHQIARILSQRGISVESMETETVPAPITGAPLFSMEALVVAPPDLGSKDWKRALIEAGEELNVDIRVTSAKPG
jgi:glycine cleavage system transcriptional repressor